MNRPRLRFQIVPRIVLSAGLASFLAVFTYTLVSVLPSQNLDFYVNLGDAIYETASNLTTSGTHNGQSWLNSPSVTLSGSSATYRNIDNGRNFHFHGACDGQCVGIL